MVLHQPRPRADFHNPDVRRYPYDLDEANAILDGLGWTDTDGDGVREDSDGNAIEFTLVTNEGNSVREAATRIIHGGMEAIGLDVELQVMDFGELVGRLSGTYDWEAVVIGLDRRTPTPTAGSTPGTAPGTCTCGIPTRPSRPPTGEAEIDEAVRPGQPRSSTTPCGWSTTAAPRRSWAENVPLVYTTLAERLSATRNVFGNSTPTLYALWDIRYLYRTDQ